MFGLDREKRLGAKSIKLEKERKNFDSFNDPIEQADKLFSLWSSEIKYLKRICPPSLSARTTPLSGPIKKQ